MNDLHTKYRPTSLKEVVGQDQVIKSLRTVIKKGQAHVFLFAGPAGVGKTTLARIVAKMFGVLPASVMEIDAATHTGVDEMRAVTEGTRYRALGDSPNKAFILDEAHRLSGNAMDSLLKILEEPPDHVYWFLCTTELGKIKPTIRSRCITYNLKPVPTETILEVLQDIGKAEKLEISDDILELCAKRAEGSVRQAITYMVACQDLESVSEARRAISEAVEGKTVIDLCRYILWPQPKNWRTVQKYLLPLRDENPESLRIIMLNYFNAILVPREKKDKETKDGTAFRVLAVMQEFEDPFPQQNGFAALTMAVGKAVFGFGG